MLYLLGLFFHHYGKVDVTMEIRTAAEKQQWRVEAGSMAGQLQDKLARFTYFCSFLCF